MPMEWEKEEILWKEVGGKQSAQILVEGDTIVPDNKPDVDEILSCNGRVKIKEVRAGEDRINISGDLGLCILYSSEQGNKPLYAMNTSLPIEDVIYMEGLEKDMQITAIPTLEHLDCQIINDRKIGTRAVIGIVIEAARMHKVDVVSDSQGNDTAFLRKKIRLEEPITEKKERFTVKEEIVLPEEAASMGEILCTEVTAVDQQLEAMDGKVRLQSNLLLDVLYSDEGETPTLHVLSEKIPFNGYLEGAGITPKSIVSAMLSVGDISLKTGLDEDGEPRVLDLEASVLADMSAWQVEEKDIVTDAYAPGMDTEVTVEKVTYPVVVGRGQNQFSIKEKLSLENGESPMMQVIQAKGEARISDVKAQQDAVEVEGVVLADILYVSPDDNHGVCMVKKGVPFGQRVEMKGVRSGDEVSAKGAVNGADFRIVSPQEGEFVCDMSLETEAKRKESMELVTDIRVKEGERKGRPIAGAVIYKVQPGDTLWNIAKRFDTTVARILLVNDIEDPDKIYPGQKLLIIKMLPR